MAKRWKLVLRLVAAGAILAIGGPIAYREYNAALLHRRALDASSKAEDALRNAEIALARLRFDREGALLPGRVAELEQSKRGLAANLEVEKMKLVRGYQLLNSPKPEDSVWAFDASQRAFESVSDSCTWLQVRADSLVVRGQIARDQIDLAGRERDSTRRALAEAEQSDVGLPGRARLRLDESRALLAQGEAKLDTAKALMAGGPGAASSAAHDAAQAACALFDQARGAAGKRRMLALEYTTIGLGDLRKARARFEGAAQGADEALGKPAPGVATQELAAARGQLSRARTRAANADKMVRVSRSLFEAQDFAGATKTLGDATDLMAEATSLAEQAKRLASAGGS